MLTCPHSTIVEHVVPSETNNLFSFPKQQLLGAGFIGQRCSIRMCRNIK